MIVTVRIYKQHDPDLIRLIENYEFDTRKAIYCAMSGYIKKQIFVITLPNKRSIPIKTSGKAFRCDLRLNDKKDQILIQFIKKLPQGDRNCTIKTILRLYLRLPINDSWAREYNDALQEGIRRADAARLDPKERFLPLYLRGKIDDIGQETSNGTSQGYTRLSNAERKVDNGKSEKKKLVSKIRDYEISENSNFEEYAPAYEAEQKNVKNKTMIPVQAEETESDDDITKMFAALLG